MSRAPAGHYRVLLLAPPRGGHDLRERLTARVDGRDAEVLVVVPALASPVEAVTGAVDDRREEAQRAADGIAEQLAREGLRARGAVGADDPLLAAEDALRDFGADEVVIADGDETLRARAQERLAVPVSLLS